MKQLAHAALLATVVAFAACDRDTPENTPPGQVLNEGSPISSSTSDTPEGQSNTEDPKTGLNSGRPDSMSDVKPGADGNTPPAPR